MKINRVLQLDFIPRNIDVALLVLRAWLGLSILVLHGWGKLSGFSEMSSKFPDPIGVGPSTSLVLAVLAEFFCAALLVLGLLTRLAAGILAITMAVAYFIVHKSALSGPASGELAFVYLAGFVTLLIAGGGRYSLDAKLGAKPSK